jgi:hypothetical protein
MGSARAFKRKQEKKTGQLWTPVNKKSKIWTPGDDNAQPGATVEQIQKMFDQTAGWFNNVLRAALDSYNIEFLDIGINEKNSKLFNIGIKIRRPHFGIAFAIKPEEYYKKQANMEVLINHIKETIDKKWKADKAKNGPVVIKGVEVTG